MAIAPIPLIAGGFDALNAQRFAWQNRNDQVEAANIARANAAQEAMNRYRLGIAQLQQQAAERDAAAREAAQRDAINILFGQKARREDARRFDVQTDLQRDQIAANERRWQFPIEREKRERDEFNRTTENFANEFRVPVALAGKQRDAAASDYQKAQQDYDKAIADFTQLPLENNVTALNYADEAKRNEILKSIADAKVAVAEAKGRLARAKESFEMSDEAFANLASNAFEKFGLAVKKSGDKYAFYRPQDARTFAAFPDELVPQAQIGPAITAGTIPAFVQAAAPATATATTPPVFIPPTAPRALPRPAETPLPRGGGTMIDFSERPISTKAAYDALPSGARFVWTYADGRQRRGVKP